MTLSICIALIMDKIIILMLLKYIFNEDKIFNLHKFFVILKIAEIRTKLKQ